MSAERFNLQAARLNAGLTIRELADETGVPRSTINRIEAGDVGGRPSNLKRLADYFGVQVTDIVPLEDRSVA